MRGRRPGQRDDHRAPVLSIEAPATVVVQGRELTFPVEVRAARSWAAQFLVDAGPARAIVEPTGLRVAPVLPGRTILTLTIVRYDDTDLGAYNEVGVVFLVRGPHGRGVYIHRLPVTQEFTLAAGREIWGFPKTRAEISIREDPRSVTCLLRQDDQDVLEISIRPGSIPFRQPALPTYSLLDGRLATTSWQMLGRARARFGGARVRLGSHLIADELRSLGLPRRAIMTTTVPRFRARFGPPRPL